MTGAIPQAQKSGAQQGATRMDRIPFALSPSPHLGPSFGRQRQKEAGVSRRPTVGWRPVSCGATTHLCQEDRA
jgi:hypothetical protein